MVSSLNGSRLVWLLRLLLVVTLMVIMLGAWTRLRDAGLGCPDWPTCYGHYTVPTTEAALERAEQLYPGHVVNPAKAWPETIHRFAAAGLGLLLTGLALYCYWYRRDGLPWRHAAGLWVLVCVQGAFGALTVTEKLYPPVVLGHLLLGFTTLTVLFLLLLRCQRAWPSQGYRDAARLRPWWWAALLALVLQIALGGWTAANYAATVCTELPICQTGWQQAWSPASAFSLFHADDQSFEFAPHLSAAEKVTIHASHRMMAIVLLVVWVAFLLRLWMTQRERYRRFAVVLACALLVQMSLGVVNVLAHLPLANAVAHNVWAAIILQCLVATGFAVFRERPGRT